MKRLLEAVRRLVLIASCNHIDKIRIMSLNDNLDYKICKSCGMTILKRR